MNGVDSSTINGQRTKGLKVQYQLVSQLGRVPKPQNGRKRSRTERNEDVLGLGGIPYTVNTVETISLTFFLYILIFVDTDVNICSQLVQYVREIKIAFFISPVI